MGGKGQGREETEEGPGIETGFVDGGRECGEGGIGGVGFGHDDFGDEMMIIYGVGERVGINNMLSK